MTHFFHGRAVGAAALLLATRLALAAPDAVAPAAAPAADEPGSKIRVQLVARDQVEVSSEISAKIASLPYRDGDMFRWSHWIARCSTPNCARPRPTPRAQANCSP